MSDAVLITLLVCSTVITLAVLAVAVWPDAPSERPSARSWLTASSPTLWTSTPLIPPCPRCDADDDKWVGREHSQDCLDAEE